MERADERPRGPELPAGLTIKQRLIILAIVVVQFFFGAGAVWKRPFDWDRSILWSYATIPLLVLIALALVRRLRLVPWLLHTVELICAKFLITAGFLVTWLWITGATPPRPATTLVEPAQAKPVATRPPPTPIAPESTGSLSGVVTDASGAPVAGALVYVASGLEKLVFRAPTQPLVIENDGSRIVPGVAGVQVAQPVILRSTDKHLHTLLTSHRDGTWIQNAPIPGSGEGRQITFDEPQGVVTVRCTVHEAREAKAYLGVFSHPFFAVTGADGRYRFTSVPAGTLSIAVFHPARGEATQPVSLEAGKQVTVPLALHAPLP